MNGAAHSIKYGILCEDIRREDNGKLILIGMYGRNIELSAVPSPLALALLIAIDAVSPGTSKIEVIASLNDEQVSKATGEIGFDGKGLTLVTLPPFLIVIKEQGTLLIRAKLETGDWAELWNGPVLLKGGST